MTISVARTHSFRAKDKLWKALVAKAEKMEMRVSEAIVEAIQDWLKK